MRRIMVIGKYRDSTRYKITRNISKAREVAEKLWKKNWAAFCPQLNSAYMDGIVPDEIFLEGCLSWLRQADAVCLVDNWEDSEGSFGEIMEAKSRDIPVYESEKEVPDLRMSPEIG